MSWRIDGAIAEAEAQIAMLEAAGLPEAARLCRARRDGLQTAKAFAELDWTDAVEEAEAEAAAEAEPEEPGANGARAAKKRAADAPLPVWTAEREAALATGWAGGQTAEALFEALGRMPGAPIGSVNAIRKRAAKHGLRRGGNQAAAA